MRALLPAGSLVIPVLSSTIDWEAARGAEELGKTMLTNALDSAIDLIREREGGIVAWMSEGTDDAPRYIVFDIRKIAE